jgi:hypothetical protein
LKFVASSEKSKFMICSDSLSCLLAIRNFPNVYLLGAQKVELYWVVYRKPFHTKD